MPYLHQKSELTPLASEETWNKEASEMKLITSSLSEHGLGLFSKKGFRLPRLGSQQRRTALICSLLVFWGSMSFVSTLREWDEAVACVEQRDPASALRIFLNIEEKSSKIFFNIGCLYLNNSELDEAEKVQLHGRFCVLCYWRKQ